MCILKVDFNIFHYTYFFTEVTTPGTTTEDTPPVLEATKDEKSEEDVQLEPTQDEMERERLTARAEQVGNRPLIKLVIM